MPLPTPDRPLAHWHARDLRRVIAWYRVNPTPRRYAEYRDAVLEQLLRRH